MTIFYKVADLIRRAGVSLLFLQFSVAASFAAELPDRIIWRITDWPPFYITSGPRQGQGIYDQMIAAFRAELTEFENITTEMTTMRALQQMKNRQEGLAVCHISMLKTSLTGFAHASDLTSILPVHVIFAHKDIADAIRRLSPTHDNFVPIKELFLNDNFKGAHTSYGTHKVTETFQYQDEPRTNVTITAESYRNLMELFINGRVDYIVQYPQFYGELVQAGADPDDVEVIEISETRDEPYVEVYAGCTKNTIGAAAIKAINRVLAAKPVALQQARLFGLSQAQRDALKKLYEELTPELNDY